MRSRIWVIIILFASLALHACGPKADEKIQLSEDSSRLLSFVSSDAIALVRTPSPKTAIEPLDSNSAIKKLPLAGLSSCKSVLFLTYIGQLTPTLVLELDEEAQKQHIKDLISASDGLKLNSRHVDSGDGKSILLITPSNAQLTSCLRHIKEGRSILDDRGFKAAADKAGAAENFVVVRSSATSKLFPKGFLSEFFPVRELQNFLHSASDFVTILPEEDKTEIIPSFSSPAAYTELLDKLPEAPCKILSMVPDTSDFILDLHVGDKSFREQYTNWIDANVKITPYHNRFTSLKKKTGKNPLTWEQEIGAQETALVCWEGRKVVMIRSKYKKPLDTKPQNNPYQDFVTALWGRAFSLTDDSHTLRLAEYWLAIGSEDDLIALQQNDKKLNTDNLQIPIKSCKLMIYTPERVIEWNKKGLYLWKSNL